MPKETTAQGNGQLVKSLDGDQYDLSQQHTALKAFHF